MKTASLIYNIQTKELVILSPSFGPIAYYAPDQAAMAISALIRETIADDEWQEERRIQSKLD